MPNQKNIENIKNLSESFSKASAIYFTKYHGLNVADITKLRSEFFKVDVDYMVAKNTLIKLAAKENEIEVDSETYEVRLNGELITCEPAKELPMAQRYFLY